MNRNLYRALPNDVANVDLTKVRRGSGYESSDRKASANNNVRYTNRSNKSRLESGARDLRKKNIQENADNNQLQHTPRSPTKKQ